MEAAARIIPAFELIAGLGMFVGLGVRAFAGLLGLTLVVFIGVICTLCARPQLVVGATGGETVPAELRPRKRDDRHAVPER